MEPEAVVIIGEDLVAAKESVMGFGQKGRMEEEEDLEICEGNEGLLWLEDDLLLEEEEEDEGRC